MFLNYRKDLNLNQWQVYPQNPNYAVTNVNGEIKLVSNVCKHQGSRLAGMQGRNERSCPFHGWRYTAAGEPAESTITPCKNAGALATAPVYIVNDFVFAAPVELDELNFINNNNLILVENRVDQVRAHWKHIVNLFLDVDHIPVVHPGVYDEIGTANIANIAWHYKENASIQLVPRVAVDTEYTQTLLPEDLASAYSAAWATVFPYTMMEWQPGAWFITVCVPVNDNLTQVNVYKYRDTRYTDLNWSINNRVWETAWRQDCNQAEQMTNFEIPDSNLEEQKLHFRRWLNQVIV